MQKIGRREFLRGAAGVAAGAGVAQRVELPGLTQPTVQAASYPSAVVSRGTNSDSAELILRTALDGLGGIERFVKPGQCVVIKPNATWDNPPKTASSTDPDLLRALVLMVRAAGASRIIVTDHCTLDPGAAECLRISGIGAVLDELDVEKVFIDRYLAPKSSYVDIDLPQGKAFQRIGVIKAVLEGDVRINLGVAKSHLVTKLTLTLKHMMGFLELPGALHAQLEQGIADINTASRIQAHLHILEAIRVRYPVGTRTQAGGNETELTDPQRVKRLNEVIAGTDPVLMDAYALVRYYARKPQELAHVKAAYELGLGEIDVDKANGEGRLVAFVAGTKPTPTPTFTPTTTPVPSATATPSATPTATGPGPTRTPLPTATAGPTEIPPAPTPMGGLEGSGAVLSPNAVLNSALLPAAAIVAGVGVAMRRRLSGKDQDSKEDKGGQ